MATRREKEQREVRYADAKERAEKHDKGFEPTALNVPKDAKLFRFKKKGLYRLDFLPYVAGKGNPFADEGFLAYERTYYAHRVPTATGKPLYVCLARTFGAPCPVCAFIAKALREGTIDQATAKAMNVKERQLFNVIDLDNSKEGVQLFEFNWFQLGKLIDSRMEKKEKYKSFYYLKGGYTVEIEVEEGSFEGRTTYKPLGISFEPRDNYDNDILDQVHNLDAIPKRLTYEELEKILLEGGEDNGEEKDAPAPKGNGRASARAKEDEDDEEEDLEDDEDEKEDDPTAESLGIVKGSIVVYRKKEWGVIKVSSDGTSLTLEDDEGEQERGVAPGDVKRLAGVRKKENGSDPTQGGGGGGGAPSAGKRTASVKSRSEEEDEDELEDEEDELDEDDELEEDEDEEPAPKKKKRAS